MLFSRIQIVYKGGYFLLFNAKSIILSYFLLIFEKPLSEAEMLYVKYIIRIQLLFVQDTHSFHSSILVI
jgi:hypothetical protein